MLKKIKLVLLSFLLMVSLSVSIAVAQTPTPTATLSDDQAAQLGQTLYQQMMGTSYTSAADQIKNVMGSDFLQQMYIAMGKLGSGNYATIGIWSMMPMMMIMMGETDTNMMENFGGNLGNMMGSFGTSFLGLSWVFMILIWVLIILGVIALIRYLGSQGRGANGKSPLEILQERYARGEIDRKEFEEKKKELE